MEKKITIVWICHFSNIEVQSKLPIWKNIKEFAPWIPNRVKGYVGLKDIDIHIISPHEYLKKQTSYTEENIHYHFIPFGVPILHRHWPQFFRFDIYSNFYFFNHKVQRLVNKINPDIINLIGAENAYYSSSILKLKDKYPVLVSIQGFIHQMDGSIKNSNILYKRIEVEEIILKEFSNFCGEQDSSTVINKFNPKHHFYKLFGPVNEELISRTEFKGYKYDCIYYGRITKTKGIEDFVKIIALLKAKNPNIKACVVGPGDTNPFIEIAKKSNCFENIDFLGFIETQKELFKLVKSSKIYLIPTYFDRLPLSIRESMMLKTPIISYATGGIPYVNEFDENIILIKTGDFEEMASKSLYLLQNEHIRNSLAEKASIYAEKEFSLQVNTNRVISACKEIISKNNKHQE